MTAAMRSEGPCAPLFFAVILLFGDVVAAQSVDMSTLELCASQETSEVRLACFEAIIAAGRASREEEAHTVELPVPEKVSNQADGTSDKPPPANGTPMARVVVASEPSANDDFGQEYLLRSAKKQEEKVSILATVTNVTKGHNKVLYFYLENGHVWRQIEPRYLSYPKEVEFAVKITRGMMGEYRMRIGDDGRMVRIRRVK